MLTQERIKELLVYHSDVGEFTRKITIGTGGQNCKVGEKIGTKYANGYFRAKIDGKYYPRSHLVWLWETGNLPKKTIDHINRNRQDDRFINLREVENLDNYKNMSKFNTNKSGHTGVSWHKKANKWMAVIVVNYKQKYLGLFDNIEDAISAREQANILYGFDSTHGKDPRIV